MSEKQKILEKRDKDYIAAKLMWKNTTFLIGFVLVIIGAMFLFMPIIFLGNPILFNPILFIVGLILLPVGVVAYYVGYRQVQTQVEEIYQKDIAKKTVSEVHQITCPHCNHKNEVENQFCGKCGSSL